MALISFIISFVLIFYLARMLPGNIPAVQDVSFFFITGTVESVDRYSETSVNASSNSHGHVNVSSYTFHHSKFFLNTGNEVDDFNVDPDKFPTGAGHKVSVCFAKKKSADSGFACLFYNHSMSKLYARKTFLEALTPKFLLIRVTFMFLVSWAWLWILIMTPGGGTMMQGFFFGFLGASIPALICSFYFASAREKRAVKIIRRARKYLSKELQTNI